MAIAIFFELCWLDILPVGTFIPPQLAASTFAALALTTHFSLVGADQIAPALILGLPLAWLGYHLEVRVRAFNNRSYNALLNWGRTDDVTDLPLLLTPALPGGPTGRVLGLLFRLLGGPGPAPGLDFPPGARATGGSGA